MGAWLDLDDAVYNHHVAKRQLRELRAELDAERKRRWDGNRMASKEHREEVLALKAERDRLREVQGELRACIKDMAHSQAWLRANAEDLWGAEREAYAESQWLEFVPTRYIAALQESGNE